MFPCSQYLTWHPFPESRSSGNIGRIFRSSLKAQVVSVRVFTNIARSEAASHSRQDPNNRYSSPEPVSCLDRCRPPRQQAAPPLTPGSSSCGSPQSRRADTEFLNSDRPPFQCDGRPAVWLHSPVRENRPGAQHHRTSRCRATSTADAACEQPAAVRQVAPIRESAPPSPPALSRCRTFAASFCPCSTTSCRFPRPAE